MKKLINSILSITLITNLAVMPISAAETSKTESELLKGCIPERNETFSSTVGTVGYNEYYQLSSKVDGASYQELNSGFSDEAKLAVGTVAVNDGVLKMSTGSKREGVAQNAKGVPFGDGVTATAWPSLKYTFTNYFGWNIGQKLSFKVKFDNVGGDRNGDLAELQFYTGKTRMCLRMTSTQLKVRDADSSFNVTHEAGITYQYIIEYIDGANTPDVVTDDYLNIYRRTSDNADYTFIGKTATLKASSSTTTVFYSRAGTITNIDDVVLYQISNIITEESLLGDRDVLYDFSFHKEVACDLFGSSGTVGNPSSSTANVVNGKLQLRVSNDTEDTDDEYTTYTLKPTVDLNDGEFLRIQGSTGTGANIYFEFDICNPGSRIRLRGNDRNGLYNGNSSNVINAASHSAGTFYDYLISRYYKSSDGKYYYKIWRKIDDDADYSYLGETLQYQNVSSGSAGTGYFIIKVQNGSEYDLERVRIYGKDNGSGTIPSRGMTLVDGKSLEVIENGQLLSNPESLLVMVSQNAGTLIYAGYDGEGRLVETRIKPVNGNTAPDIELFDATGNSNIEMIKLFLWDGFDNIKPLVNPGIVYTYKPKTDGPLKLLFNNENYVFEEEDDAPYYLSGDVYLPTDLISELTDCTASLTGNSATLTGEETLSVTIGSASGTYNGEAVTLSKAPVQQGEDVLIALDDITDYFSIGEDVSKCKDGIALHTEYYDEDDTFFNLNTTFAGDPQTMRGFSWEAMPEYDDMVIQYAEGGTLTNPTTKPAPYKTEPVIYNYHVTDPDADVSYYDNMLFYQVSLNQLKPGTTYSYRIGDTEKNIWSEVYTFKTEEKSVDEFSVIAITDSHATNSKTAADTIKNNLNAALETCNDPAFVIHCGDIVDNSMCDDWWNYYFGATTNFTTSIPTVPVVGNHETRGIGLKYFNLHFLNPQADYDFIPDTIANVNKYDKAVLEELDNTVYSFDYGDAHFVVLNTGSDWGSSYVMDLQKEWLKEDIKQSGKKWNVVLLHIGVYPARERSLSAKHLYSLMDECGVDMVLQGHDHITMRTKPIYNDMPYFDGANSGQISSENGTVYSVLGCSGIKRYDYVNTYPIPSGDWIEIVRTNEADNPTYNVLTFSSDSIKVLSKALDGTLLDSYTLTK